MLGHTSNASSSPQNKNSPYKQMSGDEWFLSIIGRLHSTINNSIISYLQLAIHRVHAVTHLVEIMRFKSGGRWFDSRWCYWNFSLT